MPGCLYQNTIALNVNFKENKALTVFTSNENVINPNNGVFQNVVYYMTYHETLNDLEGNKKQK